MPATADSKSKKIGFNASVVLLQVVREFTEQIKKVMADSL
jgi:hypothetical protein